MIKKYIIIAALIIASFAIGFFAGRWSITEEIIVQTPTIDYSKVDSLQYIIDSQVMAIDGLSNKRYVKPKVIFINKQIENETKQFYSLDSVGRIAHFREWVRDSTSK